MIFLFQIWGQPEYPPQTNIHLQWSNRLDRRDNVKAKPSTSANHFENKLLPGHRYKEAAGILFLLSFEMHSEILPQIPMAHAAEIHEPCYENSLIQKMSSV